MEFDTLLNFEDVLDTYKSKEAGIIALSKYIDWFPLKASPNLAGITADLMGDGHLQDSPKLRLDYTSKSLDELNRFNLEIYNVFRIKGTTRKCFTNYYDTYNLGINCKPIARVLKLIGVPTGSKVLTRFNIPPWILKDKRLFSRFINEIKFYLDKYFDIKTTEPFTGNTFNIRKDGIKTRPIRLKIKNRDSLLGFRDFIGIEDPAKMSRLKLITENNINKALILT